MMEITVNQVLAAVESVVGTTARPIPLHQPEFAGREWEYVKDCLDTGWVSSVGEYVSRFESRLSEYCGVGHAVAVMNGTAALHVCLMLSGVQPRDEVLMPALTFVGTANAVAYCGATPHFVDSDEYSLGVDPVRLDDYLREMVELRGEVAFNRRTGARVSALIVMHTFGHPVDMDALQEVANRFHLALVEDAAESLGSRYKGRHTGGLARLGALSFNGNKVVTTGGGGAILTNNPTLGARAKHVTTTARIPHRWSFLHDEIGYNYRMPNLNAALGCAQLEQLDGFISRKRALADRYANALAGIEGVRFFREPAYAQSNYWLNVLLLNVAFSSQRDALLEATNAGGVGTRPIWTLMNHLPMFRDCPSMPLPVALSLESRVINLPSSAGLG